MARQPKRPAQSLKPSLVIKRSVKIAGHRNSVSLEEPFWNAVKEIAAQKGMTVVELVTLVGGSETQRANLSSTIRLFVLEYYRR